MIIFLDVKLFTQNGVVNVVAVMHGDPKVKFMDNFIKVLKECKKIESQATRLAQLKQTIIESEDKIIEAVKPKIKEEIQLINTRSNCQYQFNPQLQQVKSKRQQSKRSFAITSEPGK